MPFLKNAWYVAAWGREVGRALFARRILGDPILMFRREDGVAIALADRCAHRFAPLSMGHLRGDIVECRYHGLRFDGAGVCVRSPHGDGAVPKSARVRAYPLVERYQALWIWMGEPERADPSRIPDFSFLVDGEKYATVTAASSFQANYELITDNLMDVSHVSYLHAESFGATDIAPSEMEVSQVGTTVSCNRLCRDDRSQPPIRNALVGYEGPVDFWLDMRWDPPSNMRFSIGLTPAGHPRSDGVCSLEPHLLTPETETSTHYFWGDSRDYLREDPGVSAMYEQLLRGVFDGEDKLMIEAQQRNMGTTDLMALRPALLKSDGAAIRVRQILADLIAAEQADRKIT